MIPVIIGQLQIVNTVLNVNLEGVDHQASVKRPEPAGNSLNWIVGHLVATYDHLLPVLGGEPVLAGEQKALYDRGTTPLADAEKAVPIDTLRQAFATAHERVVEGLGKLPEERLAEPAPFSPTKNPDETLGSLLAILTFHQAYHVGQLGIGRRLAGLSGAIA